MQIEPNKLISFTEASREYGIARFTFYQYIKKGKLNHCYIGHAHFLYKEEIENLPLYLNRKANENRQIDNP